MSGDTQGWKVHAFGWKRLSAWTESIESGRMMEVKFDRQHRAQTVLELTKGSHRVGSSPTTYILIICHYFASEKLGLNRCS